jgi:site-specific DNA recombinase
MIQSPSPQPIAALPEAFTKRAVIYLRVSTAKQVGTDDVDPDGYSIPAQRDACRRKAEALGAEIVEEFIDRGSSAKTADRPQFRRLISRVTTERDIDYVILDKIDRFARNRRDDANLLFELRQAGAELVSVKENIDETPAGVLLHGILATMAEWESRTNAARTLTAMTQKAKGGGTPGRAPVGYLNVPRRIDGREVRVVAVDPERAPLVQWAFEAYATGQYTVRSLHEALTAKGMRTLPQGKGIPGPIPISGVAKLLSNRYYLGYVSFRGVEYEGRHQPLVSTVLFEQVQEMLRSRRTAGEKQRVHHHYLKGTVFCGRCGSRLCLTNAKGQYLYFFCLGRHQRRTDCQQRYLLASDVEAAVERFYRHERLSDELQDLIRNGVLEELGRQRQHSGPEIAWAKRQVESLAAERRRLGRETVKGNIPGDLAREEHDRIDRELADAQRILAAAEAVSSHIEGNLDRAVALLGRVDEIYRQGGPKIRRLSNQFLFEKLLIREREVAGAVYREPWATLRNEKLIAGLRRNARNPGRRSVGQGSKMIALARLAGFEPATPSSGSWCSIH